MDHARITLAAALASLALSASAAGLTTGDKNFIQRASRDGMAELQLGKLAQQKAARDEVRQFATRIVEDHGKANEELSKLSGAKGFEAPKLPAKDFKRLEAKLHALSGPDFDREYMAHMVREHKKAIGFFAKQASRGTDRDLRAFAARTLPTLRSHLENAEVTRDIANLRSSAKAQ